MTENKITKIEENTFFNFFVFIFSGLVFISAAQVSMNFSLYLSKIFSVIAVELIFLVFIFTSFKYIFSKIKNSLFSYSFYAISSGFLGVLVVDFLINKNNELNFGIIVFLFFLRALEFSVARIASDNKINLVLRESFLKRILLSYIIYIFVSLFFVFILSSKNIWSFGFIILHVVFIIYFFIFLYRLAKPKKKKMEKPLFDDVTFY